VRGLDELTGERRTVYHVCQEVGIEGAGYGVAAGVMLAVGSIALYAAYRTGANTAVVTTATGLYPMVSVLLAIIFLKERLTRVQVLGVLFAIAAMVIFSL